MLQRLAIDEELLKPLDEEAGYAASYMQYAGALLDKLFCKPLAQSLQSSTASSFCISFLLAFPACVWLNALACQTVSDSDGILTPGAHQRLDATAILDALLCFEIKQWPPSKGIQRTHAAPVLFLTQNKLLCMSTISVLLCLSA